MKRHGAWVLSGVVLVWAFLQVPVGAQRSRVPPSAEAAASSRVVVEKPATERAAVVRAVTVPAPSVQPAAPTNTVRPGAATASAPSVDAGSGRRADAGQTRGDSPRQGDGRRGDPGGDDRGGRRDGRPVDPGYGLRGAIVINPVVVYSPTIGSVPLGPTTTIGQTVIIGGQTTGQPPVRAYAPLSRPYGYSGYVAYVPEETIEIVNVGSSAPSAPASVEEPVSTPVEETRELRSSEIQAAPRRQPSLASLGSQYSFRPWYAVSEFVMAGYPLAYPEVVAYDKAALSPDATLPQAALDALEIGVPLVPYAVGTFGGITFQIEPVDAAVYVDGIFVGLIEDYTPATAPLPLPIGPHRIELRASGFRVERFDVIVTLGQVTPLSGLLARAH